MVKGILKGGRPTVTLVTDPPSGAGHAEVGALAVPPPDGDPPQRPQGMSKSWTGDSSSKQAWPMPAGESDLDNATIDVPAAEAAVNLTDLASRLDVVQRSDLSNDSNAFGPEGGVGGNGTDNRAMVQLPVGEVRGLIRFRTRVRLYQLLEVIKQALRPPPFF